MPLDRKPLSLPKACIFCGTKGALTGEDFIPVWLKPHIPPEGKIIDHQVDTANYIDDGRIIPQSSRAGSLLRGLGQVQKTLKVVCGRCNNTWMSGIQMACKPHFLAYINQGWTVLDKSESLTLSKWATMHVMVREFATNMRTISPRERGDFYIDQSPLPNWSIWIAQYNGKTPVAFSALAAIRRLPVKNKEAEFVGHTHASYVIIGRLIIHCVGTHRTEILPYLRGDYSKALGFTPIWLDEAVAVGGPLKSLTEDQCTNFIANSQDALGRVFKD